MNNEQSIDNDRRNWVVATCVVGGLAGVAAAVPLVSTFAPSEEAKAAGAPVEVDVSGMTPGEMKTVAWRGKPVWVLRRSPEMVAALPGNDSQLADPQSRRKQNELTPPYARNENRSIKPEYLVVVGICSHLGCSPSARFQPGPQANLPDDWAGGFLCPCHGSTFDLSGRVYKNKPAPDNLEVPPHKYLSESRILIGDDNKA